MDGYLTYFTFVSLAFFAGLILLRWLLLRLKRAKILKSGKNSDVEIITARPVDLKNRLITAKWRGNEYLIFVGNNDSFVVDKADLSEKASVQNNKKVV